MCIVVLNDLGIGWHVPIGQLLEDISGGDKRSEIIEREKCWQEYHAQNASNEQRRDDFERWAGCRISFVDDV